MWSVQVLTLVWCCLTVCSAPLHSNDSSEEGKTSGKFVIGSVVMVCLIVVFAVGLCVCKKKQKAADSAPGLNMTYTKKAGAVPQTEDDGEVEVTQAGDSMFYNNQTMTSMSEM